MCSVSISKDAVDS